MSDTHTRGEMHGCIVCGRLYELYVVYDSEGNFIDCKVMSTGGVRVPSAQHPLVACDHHDGAAIERALERVYGDPNLADE
jgi:hypothetical protein